MNLIRTFALETGGGSTQPEAGDGGAAVKAEQQIIIDNRPVTVPDSQKAGADFVLPLMILVLLGFKGRSNCKKS
ncbi:MAG: hypothetical protein KJ856_10695 [Gammaproteobacteria bacterium]|nr:hypothetical protein [Gammaproteobacteria bacterium]MBU1477114.1 hypothetical protein [Gammaproteobacteria bacterium]MBU2003706.1 hypothetical protein [Gammaproteobacteria bacterium]MBU2134090.1 hypothetical protein [Gammaproteobacteria bacterium]MBU2187467.1 hypothetical protein [Gammaproteobacteria bacterium]